MDGSSVRLVILDPLPLELALTAERDQPVQGGPQEQAGMGMMATAGTRLPNALVREVPVLGGVLAKADERLLHLAIEFAAVGSVLRGGIDHLAIDVQLQLVASGVADAHRTGPAIALE